MVNTLRALQQNLHAYLDILFLEIFQQVVKHQEAGAITQQHAKVNKFVVMQSEISIDKRQERIFLFWKLYLQLIMYR